MSSFIIVAALAAAPQPSSLNQITEHTVGFFPQQRPNASGLHGAAHTLWQPPQVASRQPSQPAPLAARTAGGTTIGSTTESSSAGSGCQGSGCCPAPCVARRTAVLHRLRGSPFCPAACRGVATVDAGDGYTQQLRRMDVVLLPSDLQHPLLRMQAAVRDSAQMLHQASGRGKREAEDTP